MERYLIALDLDGTTLNTEGQLSAGTIAVLRAAQAAGHLVVITTGRPDAISEQFYDTLHLQGPMINFKKKSRFRFRLRYRYASSANALPLK